MVTAMSFPRRIKKGKKEKSMKRLQIIRLIAAVLLLVLIMPAAQAGGAPPKITTTGLPRAVVGVPYSARISSVDDPSTPTAFNIYYNPGGKNDFPTTLTLTSKGVIQGTPNKAGTFTFSVQAANGWGEDYKVLTLRVIDVNDLREGGENTSIVGMGDDPLTGVANAVNGGMVVVHADIAYFLDAKGYLYQAPAATGKGALAYKAREYAWLDSLGDTLYYYHRYLSERGKSKVSLTHKRPTGKTSNVYVTRVARDPIGRKGRATEVTLKKAGISDLSVTDKIVLYIQNDVLVRSRLGTDKPVTLYAYEGTSQRKADHVFPYNGYAYFRDKANGCLYRVALDGEIAQKLTDEKVVAYTAADLQGQAVLYYANTSKQVFWLPLEGGTPQMLAGIQATALNADQHHVYFVNAADGHSPSRFVPGEEIPEKLVDAKADSIYVFDEYIAFGWRGALHLAPKEGGEAIRLRK